MSELDLKAQLEECFDFFDTDSSGFMEFQELYKAALKFNSEHTECGCKMTEEDVKAIIEALDKDKDSKVSKKEFVDFLYQNFTK